MCGLSCPDGTPADPITDANGDGVDDNADGNDSSSEGGNTTNLNAATSDTTIAIESSRIVDPSGNATSLSLLTAGTSPATTTAQILSGTKPTKLTIRIDTNSDTNGEWPTPIQMTEYPTGTNAPDLTGGNNGGAGANYREYRVYSNQVGQERDESLQVWAWTDSYATQYRNTPSGGEAIQQAWSFGGNKTPLTDPQLTGGTATYNGRFVATAKTENYVKPSGADIDPNALWRVQGASTLTANFGAGGTVNGALTPETWTSYQEGISGTYMKTVGSAGTIAQPDYGFYNTTVDLNGTITGNTYAGTADLSGPFISGDQTMYGGFFGTGASETTGVFHVNGVDPYPVGGEGGINDDKRGYLTINGAFNGQ
jgi:C-lobe and N-lobe beta barrels of Tf-binding protein B